MDSINHTQVNIRAWQDKDILSNFLLSLKIFVVLVLYYALATWYKSAKIIANWCPQPHSNHKLKQGEHTPHPTLRTYPTPNIEIWLLLRCLCILCMENVYKWWNIHPWSIKNEMDHKKCLKRRKYCNRIQFSEICLRPVAGGRSVWGN